MLDTGQDLARIPDANDPVNLLVATRSTPPIVITATGGWAGSALAGAATRELTGEAAGLSSTACAPPRAEWWFVGAGSRLGRRAALLVSNASQEPASFDITLHAQSGPVEALAGKGITLGPQSRVRLRLDALAEGEDVLSVHVHATSGRVSAALRDVAQPVGERPRGVDYLPAAAEPANVLWIPGVPAGTRRKELVLVNPGDRFASVSARLISSSGTTDPPALVSLPVPAGSSIRYPLDDPLGEAAGTLELHSDAPVTAAVKAVWGRPARQDLLWLAATPPLAAPNTIAGAAQVPSGPGLTTTVTIAAPEGDVRGTLEVLATGDPSAPVLGRDGPLESGELARQREADSPAAPVVLVAPTTRLPTRASRCRPARRRLWTFRRPRVHSCIWCGTPHRARGPHPWLIAASTPTGSWPRGTRGGPPSPRFRSPLFATTSARWRRSSRRPGTGEHPARPRSAVAQTHDTGHPRDGGVPRMSVAPE